VSGDTVWRDQAWYPDPYGRAESRYFDGAGWTEHVSSHGRQSVDPPGGESRVPTVNRRAKRILADVAKAEGPTDPPAGPVGPLFTEPVLVVSQKAKLIEIHNEYAIHDGSGTQIGAVREVGLNTAKKLLRAFTRLDTMLDHTYQVVDMSGTPVLVLSHPSEPFRAGILVEDGSGQEVGRIIQENMVGKIRFRLKAYDAV
jgi:hypothetical protein